MFKLSIKLRDNGAVSYVNCCKIFYVYLYLHKHHQILALWKNTNCQDDEMKSFVHFYTLATLVIWVAAILGTGPAHAGRLEAGSFTAHTTSSNPNPVRINFQQAFDTVPIVVALADSTGGQPASIRITNISTTGFDELILEVDNANGPHAAQLTHYIAVEPGRHVLPDGRIVEAGRINTSATQFGTGVAGTASWASISFSSALPSTPSVITQIQTANSETRNVASQTSRPHITAIARNLATSGFQLALDRSQANSGPIPSTETVGWIAFPSGVSGTFPDVSSNTITWSTVNTAANIRGWQNGCFVNSFGQTSATRIVVAKKITRNNQDGGWLRQCSLSSTNIGVRIDEDRDQDNERQVAVIDSESASIIAFSQSFHALLEPIIGITTINNSFVDDLGGDFAIPGATVEYLVTVQNVGNAPPNFDSVIVTEIIPAELSLVVTDFGAPGSGPVQYQDGTPASGLVYSFGGLGNTGDSIAFSTDGTNFNYTPVDGGDGTDSNITHVRMTPAGYMAANTGGGATTFTLRFNAKIN